MSQQSIERKPIVEKCNGCAKIDGEFCTIWASPIAKWKLGNCPSATHVKTEISEPGQKVRVGQQKQKKKGA